MKIKFITIKKRVIIGVLLTIALFIGGSFLVRSVKASANVPKYEYSIVIDAGHGGADVKLGHIHF